MIWLLDSNAWIYYLKNVNLAVRARLQQKRPGDIRTCSIVLAELLYGALKYGNPEKRLIIVRETLSLYHSLPFDNGAAIRYAAIRHELELKRTVIGPNDLLIAAVCLEHDCTLVTSNMSEFSRVRNLRLEDWTQPLPT